MLNWVWKGDRCSENRKSELPGLIAALEDKIAKRPNRYMKDQLQEELDALEDEMDEIDDHILRRNQTLDRITKKYTEDYYMANAEALTWGYDDFLPSELHLPVNHEAIAKITAMDVLHNFYVPHMKVKMDAVPVCLLHSSSHLPSLPKK